jgi:hypothetical protein
MAASDTVRINPRQYPINLFIGDLLAFGSKFLEFTHYTPEMTLGQLQHLCPALTYEICAGYNACRQANVCSVARH